MSVARGIASGDGIAGLGPRAGLIGAVVFAAGSLVAALAFEGPNGRYSPLSHWVSELGEVGLSSLGPALNVSLIVGGVGLAGFMAAFAASRGDAPASAAGLAGIASGILGALVGVFPAGGSDLHRPVSIGFFLLGAVTLAFASLDIARRPTRSLPGWLAAVGALVVAAFVGFIVVTLARGSGEIAEPRGVFLLEPALEWAAVGGILAWTAAASVTWARSRA